MSRVRSPPISPANDDPDQHSQYSRTYSTSSSSRNTHHSRSQSLASSNGRHNSSSVNLEATARAFYYEIKAYIASLLAREAAEGVSPQRAGARSKLTKLSNQQFHELSMDVYDELMRRNADDRMFPFLPVRDDFHPKRNQARQKLATLPKTRFKDLASDADARPPMPPIPPTANGHMSKNISNAMAQPSQSTNIVPVMGTMNIEVVDATAQPPSNSDSTNFQSLDSLMADLGNMVTKDQIKSSSPRDDMEKYDELEEKYKQMEEDYQQQQEVVNDVRREVTNLLEELKDLSRKNGEITIEKEQAQDKLSVVENESKEWQRKFEKAKTELRNLKGKERNKPPKLEVLGDDLLRPTEDGAISQDHVINYQVAVDDLLRSGRSEKPSSVLIAMKAVVVSCKAITEDVEAYENDETKDIDAEKKDRLYAMKSQFSKGLSNLMVAAKTHANGMGISPVSLLDAAATHLTSTVVELIKLFGMRNGKGSDRDSAQPEDGGKQAGSPPDKKPQTCPAYLKRQTDQVVQTIQQLLAALRTPSRCDEVAPIITSIVTIVGNVSTVAKSSFNTPAGGQFRKDGEMILQDLQSTRSKLVSLRDGHFVKNPLDAPANAKKDLAKESYEVAKFTRELLGIL
ncbi:hypothetical protein BGW37DRAFT_428357 [Umbelopsis sp. PMI_123]|nr:hypothetical protein BGW37DRAFT_428357 [Umbelopsis sp. PMI_123]